MKEQNKQVLSKKTAIKRGLLIYFGTLFVIAIFIFLFVGSEFNPSMEKYSQIVNLLIWMCVGFFIFVAAIVFASYKYHNKHPKIYNEMNSKQGKIYISWAGIIVGAYFILQGLYIYFVDLSKLSLKASLFKIILGAILLVWGCYDLRKNKKDVESQTQDLKTNNHI